MSGDYLSADGDDAAKDFWKKIPKEDPASRFAGVVFNCCSGRKDGGIAAPLPWYPWRNFGVGPGE